jgi:hypothetical protein
MDKVTITKDNWDSFPVDLTIDKDCSVKADDESTASKTVTLRVKYAGVTVKDVIMATLGQGVVVKWQNGAGGRKNYDKLVDKSIVNLDFKAPGIAPKEDPKDAFLREAKAEGVDVTDKKALSAYIIKRLGV